MRVIHALGLAAAVLCGAARADGLADLKGALGRMQAHTPVKATLETRTWRKVGEGKEAEEFNGAATITVEDGGQGLRLQYPRDLLARLDAENQGTAKNPNAKTPTIYALREVGPDDLRPMTSAAEALARNVERTVYKSEKPATHNGKPARLLTFSVPINTLSDRQRKHLKEFEGTLEVWIGAEGTPLASRLDLHGSGRAFVVVSFEFRQEEQCTYALSGDRLLMTRNEKKIFNAGAGEKSEERMVRTLQAG
ncbi:hypothetical protein [Pseudoduganella namucuonensis]|uniref:Uncharacterized protein n=1 Tax=Pseudoduganella namucuonensis TaxID=1035707 RepID=A0A1I7I3F3_9BURK|nr:hypothetical protein [Pseudoduganella namucuonensis]SFU67276.1 hypothetical protein SAMN05216552_100754 [Pseudoduganella namucuonensis]